MDRQAEELRQGITGATVERIGEGIRVTFPAGLLYDDVGSDRVRPTASETLRSFARSVGGYPNTELLVVGYADADGTVIYDKDLSERRARSVSEYLAREGVDPGRVHESGRGEAEPVASGGTEAGRRQNRRVEVAIFASERYRSEMKARSATGSR
jgi:outer membrane protein OmpA-like peptidoglycan-associated protein